MLPTIGKTLRLDPRDNLRIALADLSQGDTVADDARAIRLVSDVPAKHKFAVADLAPGAEIRMYGVMVGRATVPIREGEVITTRNIRHDVAAFHDNPGPYCWQPPDVSRWRSRTFRGFRRADGQVGTRNYWLVVPLVFCENRNLEVLKHAFQEELGLAPPETYRRHVAELVELYRHGKSQDIGAHVFGKGAEPVGRSRVFARVDGVKFLMHQGGCGGTREDTDNLCGLLAGYIHHPNVAGATVLSLGCQHAQVAVLRQAIAHRDANFTKPLLIFEQQQSVSEAAMLDEAIRQTFLGLVEANQAEREEVPLAELCVALKCGGSDGFSGLSANPAVGHVSDLLVALGGRSILAEFPELCGVEQDLINRSVNREVSNRFIQLMRDYAARAQAVRAGFDMNPSPGNIRDGLVTDAMKSAGAEKKGGRSAVTAVLDYPQYSSEAGLNLLCTPGSDVECVTAQVGAGANVVLFTTGLGTPTGNPIAPVIKIASNSKLAKRMPDIIDFDAGPIVGGEHTVEQTGEEILELAIQVASGARQTQAERLAQDDFIPWKRGVSL